MDEKHPFDRGGIAGAQSDGEVSGALSPWMQEVVQHEWTVADDAIPRDMMWARIRQQRQSATQGEAARQGRSLQPEQSPAATPVARRTRHVGRWFALAATLLMGVAIGRYGNRAANAVRGATDTVASTSGGMTNIPTGIASTADARVASPLHANDPVAVAMDEHLAHSIALLTTVRNERPEVSPAADVSLWARGLLRTTRLLLDEPQLRSDSTTRLLQDLELVLVQIVQARDNAAPEARRAPSETMRETNLLPRVRAAVTPAFSSELPTRGIAE